jgi:hypothetical protein
MFKSRYLSIVFDFRQAAAVCEICEAPRPRLPGVVIYIVCIHSFIIYYRYNDEHSKNYNDKNNDDRNIDKGLLL